MGNCLKRAGSGQQDNTTLLSNNSDPPTLTSGSLQEGLGPPIPNNVILISHYASISRDIVARSSIRSVRDYLFVPFL